MLEDFWAQKYYARMKNKKLFSIFLTILAIIFASPNFCSAEPSSPQLVFSAINAGYKDGASAQNYDFIELKKNIDDALDITGYKITYFNSSDKESGSITFDGMTLNADRLVLGYAKSPQYQDEPEIYQYTFSSSGLASTAGRLTLTLNDEIVDEICWGKTICENNLQKFATKSEDNMTARLCEEELCEEKYYYEQYYTSINHEALESIVEPEPEEEPEPEVEPVSCAGIIFTEVFGYYEESSSEQFIEIFNNTTAPIALDGCRVSYKNKEYPLIGTINNSEYLAIRDVVLTKNPTSDQVILLLDDNGIVDMLNYPHGQKKGTSFIRSGDEWKLSYTPTPAAENIYQEFRSCPEGKIINPETGNCIKEEVTSETAVKQCPEGKTLNPLTGRCKNIPVAKATKTCEAGYYLNPATGRCKKNEVATTKECPEGYERNPETNRCRKVYKNTAQEYPVEPVEQGSYDNPRIFIAVGALVLIGATATAYIVWQFREEIRKFFVRNFRRKRKLS